MRVLYLDCFSGISGDMFIGALIDAGLNFRDFKNRLNGLGVGRFRLEKKKVRRGALSGTKFSVITAKDASHRKLSDIESLIKRSRLEKDVKETSMAVFNNLVHSEAKSHGSAIRNVHIHEAARLDSIVDVVGIAIALKQLKIDKIYASIVRLGKGKTRISHGIIPIPVPSTLSLLRESRVKFTNINKELVTPTGAAVLKTLACDFGGMPDMKILKVGYGAGSRDLKAQPNMLRAVIGQASPYLSDTIKVLETNIDDMNPQIFEFLCQKLFKAGALDVYLMPVFMKKFRPGILLTVLCKGELIPKLSSIIFKETTSTGIRFYSVERNKLDRVIQKIHTNHGKMRFKFSFAPGLLKVRPEHDDCRRVAGKESITLKKLYEEIIPDRR